MRRSAVHRLAAVAVSGGLIIAACADDADGPDPAGADEQSAPDVDEESAAAGDPDTIFPGEGWSDADPEDMGFDPDKLEELAAEAEEADSTCLVVTRDGQIVAEWYWGGTDATTMQEAWSVTKSYTSTLVGIAAAETDLDLDDRAAEYIEQWIGTGSEDITIRNILSNDSGRTWLSSLGFDDSYIALTTADDRTAYALDLGQDTPPGTEWEYNDGAIQALQPIVEGVTGQTPADYAREKIFEPIGAEHSEMSLDAAGNTAMYFGLQTTCQDMARYGYLLLQDGVWDGDQVLPEGWVEQATAPSQDLNPAYGYLWWLSAAPDPAEDAGADGDGATDTTDDQDTADDEHAAPAGMYWAQGLGGQTIQVHPETGTVVTRLGSQTFGGGYGSGDTTRFVTEALVD
jgi:CubicO group peptidase (beta-lactamase class C family)